MGESDSDDEMLGKELEVSDRFALQFGKEIEAIQRLNEEIRGLGPAAIRHRRAN